jgi:hypothetical protein
MGLDVAVDEAGGTVVEGASKESCLAMSAAKSVPSKEKDTINNVVDATIVVFFIAASCSLEFLKSAVKRRIHYSKFSGAKLFGGIE